MNKFLLTSSVMVLLSLFLIGGICTKTVKKLGCDCEELRMLEKRTVLSASNSTFEYSSYPVSGMFQADSACHANMEIVYKWENPELATTDVEPPITVEYLSPMGYFLETGNTSEYRSDGRY